MLVLKATSSVALASTAATAGVLPGAGSSTAAAAEAKVGIGGSKRRSVGPVVES